MDGLPVHLIWKSMGSFLQEALPDVISYAPTLQTSYKQKIEN